MDGVGGTVGYFELVVNWKLQSSFCVGIASLYMVFKNIMELRLIFMLVHFT